MMKPFEPFEPTQSAGKIRGVPTVRALSQGRLILNAAAARAITADRVQLLWDEATKRLGIKPTSDTDPLGFLISRTSSSATITSKGFVASHPIPYNQRMKLALEEGLWVASTTDPANPSG
jgi:hypothetical protein